MLTFIKTGRPYSRPTWSGQNCPRRSKSTITIMANTLTVTTHQVANLGIILTEVESVSVSLIVSNPGPYSSVVLDAEVKVTEQIIIESFCKRWTILSLKDCKLHDRGFLVAWTPLRATTQEDRLFACFGCFFCLFVVSFFVCLNTYSCQDSEGQVVEKQHSVFKYFQVACGKLFVEKAKREPVLMMGIVGRSFN